MRAGLLTLFFLTLCLTVLTAGSYELPALAPLKDSATGKNVRYAGELSDAPVMIPSAYPNSDARFRGVWVATIENIDFPKCATVDAFKQAAADRLDNIRRAGFHAVLFQVRPASDAFYESKLNPWSRFLTGTEGVPLAGDRNFDPLAYLVKEAHARGLEFHAWLNPYRVANAVPESKTAYLKKLDANNFAARKPRLVLSAPAGGGKHLLILNPGEPEVILFLADTVSEILRKYEVDAIHLDDYFYPYADIGSADAATYRKYAAKGQTLDNWRRANVDRMVEALGQMIRHHNRRTGQHVKFGISPFGIWANRTAPAPRDAAVRKKWEQTPSDPNGSLTCGSQSYFKQYADTRKWVREGWVDYIVPQLYWPFGHDKAAYAALADWWAEQVKGTNVTLYIGLAMYRPGTGSGWEDPNELTNQLKYNLLHPEIKGAILFSYRRLFEPDNAIQKKAGRIIVESIWGGRLPRNR